MDIQELIEKALDIFPESIRPEHFTGFDHCDECFEHDQTLRHTTREKITFDALGNPAWDPICFVNEAGFIYYFPAMVRLALHGKGETYYIGQFLFHLSSSHNCMSFSRIQSEFVIIVLEYLLLHRADEIEENLDADLLLLTLEMWQNSEEGKS